MFALCSHPVTISDQELYKKTKRSSVVDEIKSRRQFDSVCLEGIIQVALRWTPSGILGVLEKVCFIKL